MIPIRIQNKQDFLGNFLSPISKLTENTVIRVRKNSMNALCSSNDGTLIVNCTMEQDNDVEETIYLNIPDINRLIKVLTCIQDDTDLSLNYNNNNIEYKSPDVGFKYHLLDDGIIDPPQIDIEKIKKIDFNFTFAVSPETINQLIKASTFTTDTNKIYFTTTDGMVYASLTDKQRHNVDSFTQIVSRKYEGDSLSEGLALSFETIRVISSIRFDSLTVRVNPGLNVFLFEIKTNKTTLLVISSGFVG